MDQLADSVILLYSDNLASVKQLPVDETTLLKHISHVWDMLEKVRAL